MLTKGWENRGREEGRIEIGDWGLEVGDWRLGIVCNLKFLSYQLLFVICANQRINLRKSARNNFPDVN